MTTRDITLIALFAAITAALGLMPPLMVPVIGVPITAQSLGPMLAGSLLGARRGGLAIALFVGLVALGLPLLSGGRGGMGVLMGPSGGYIIGWVLAAFAIGCGFQRLNAHLNLFLSVLILILGGILLVHASGIIWLINLGKFDFDKAVYGSLAFLPGDLLKVAGAAAIARVVKRDMPDL